MRPAKISESAVRRLSLYLRVLEAFELTGKTTVSSGDLAERGGMTPAQVRKDLSHFGSFGKRGLGYPVSELRERVTEILGLGRRWRVGLVGAGKLGAALFFYDGFRGQGFDVVAVLDNDPCKIGQRWDRLVVEDIESMDRVVREAQVEMGIIVTPADGAQQVADRLIASGVEAMLNFAPTRLRVPPGITLRNVNLEIELESLAFALTHENGT